MNRKFLRPDLRPPRRVIAAAAILMAAGCLPPWQDAYAEWGGVGGFSNIQPPVINPTSTDSDGDGMPNSWENSNSLNSSNPADATSDFDQDGLTALQEYGLYQATSGQYGKPRGTWSASPAIRPAGFATTPIVNLIEVASNGTVLVRVQGKLTGSTVTTTCPTLGRPPQVNGPVSPRPPGTRPSPR